MAACLLACAACSTDASDIWDDENREEEVPGTGGGSSGTQDATGNLLDFDISWDDVTEDGFADAVETVVTDAADSEYDDFVENSFFPSVVYIAYADGSATVSGTVDGVTLTSDGAHVTVNSTVAGVEYVLSGTATDGSLKVYSSKKFKLTLAGVSLTSTKGAAINIQSGKRVFVELKEGTENTLTDASAYTNTVDGEDQKACFFSEGQLIFGGTGLLTVNANYKHGICSDDYVRLRSGSRIAVASAPKDGIHTNDAFVMGGGVLKLTVSGDGVDCEEGAIDIRGGLLKAAITGAAAKALKAETDVTIGGGQLVLLTAGDAEYDADDADISSPAGIKCGGDFRMADATLSIKSTGSAGKGINCDGTLTVESGTLKVIITGKQYVYGSLDSSAKGIKADGALTIEDGTVWVRTTGDEDSEGIESKSTLTINGGEVAVFAYDDCLNATSSIAVNGGSVYCYSSANDGLDSNGTLSITGGTIVASGTTVPEEGIDCDQNTFRITGGTLVGIGGATSTPTASACTQRSVVYSGSGTAGALFSIVASDGTQVMSYVVPRAYGQMTVLFSSAQLASGASYTVCTGGTVSGGSSFYGLTTGGTLTDGSSSASFTTSSMVTTVGGSSGGGGGGRP